VTTPRTLLGGCERARLNLSSIGTREFVPEACLSRRGPGAYGLGLGQTGQAMVMWPCGLAPSGSNLEPTALAASLWSWRWRQVGSIAGTELRRVVLR